MSHFFSLVLSSLIFMLAAQGCGKSKLIKADLLENLRILDLVASAPEVDAGANVTVTPYLSDPKGAGRSLTVSREVCIDFGVNLGAKPTCSENSTRTVLTQTSETPGSAANLYTGSLSSSTFNVPGAGVIYTDPSTGVARTANSQYNGVAYLFFLTVTASDGESRTAFKRIIVSTKTSKNQNPILSNLLFGTLTDSDPSLTQPTRAVILSATTPAAQEETYSAYTDSGTLVSRTEAVSVFWYATAGSFFSTVTDFAATNIYTPPTIAPSIVTYVGILKDSRGGSSIRVISK